MMPHHYMFGEEDEQPIQRQQRRSWALLLLSFLALLLTAGCASVRRAVCPAIDQTVVEELVCRGDVAGAAAYVLEVGGSNADMLARVIQAQRKCRGAKP